MKMLRQGFLLNTSLTRRYTPDQRKQANYEESKRCFFGFQSIDEGRSRVHHKTFDTPEECNNYVRWYNEIGLYEESYIDYLDMVECEGFGKLHKENDPIGFNLGLKYWVEDKG